MGPYLNIYCISSEFEEIMTQSVSLTKAVVLIESKQEYTIVGKENWPSAFKERFIIASHSFAMINNDADVGKSISKLNAYEEIIVYPPVIADDALCAAKIDTHTSYPSFDRGGSRLKNETHNKFVRQFFKAIRSMPALVEVKRGTLYTHESLNFRWVGRGLLNDRFIDWRTSYFSDSSKAKLPASAKDVR